jgi:hypothetical protein
MKRKYTIHAIRFLLPLFLGISSCDDFIKIDPPRTALVKSTVFENNATAEAAVYDIYYRMSINGFASGDLNSITFLTSLASDEQTNYYASTPAITAEIQQFNDNSLAANNSYILGLWSEMYKVIYKTTAVIEGLSSSTRVTEGLKRQLMGEAKFVRAFCNFYLVNLFGDVPLVTTTDYRTNSEIARTPAAKVYQQIFSDLTDAQGLLVNDYTYSSKERVRANRGAATALLARTYLYVGDWANAEAQATQIITNPDQYSLVANLNDVSRKNNEEVILQFWNNEASYPNDFNTFYVFYYPFYGALTDKLINGFEASDNRRTLWIGFDSGFYFPTKYSSFYPGVEYSIVLRVAEQYLIRAEARAQQNNLLGAKDDIAVIRNRAGLGEVPANDQAALLLAIEQERRSELFTEWGHRWFDLKRTKRANAVLSSMKSQWVSTAVLFPIPESEIRNNVALKNSQNPGY